MMRFSIIKQNRFRTLVCEGYRYSRYMVVYNKEYWRCTDRSCKGKLHLSSGRIVYVKRNGHSHGPDHKGISAGQALFIIQKRSRTGEVAFEQIYEETVREFEELGHGPMRELLPYDEVVWKIQKQLLETSETQGLNKVLLGSEGNRDAEGSSRSIADAATEENIAASQSGDEKPDVSCVDVINAEGNAFSQSSPSSTNSVTTIITRPLISIMPASLMLSTQNRRDHITHNAPALQTTSITTPSNQQNVSSDNLPGLKIQSTFSLQSGSLGNASLSNQQDTVQRIESCSANTDVNLHAASNASVSVSHQPSGSTYSGAALSTSRVGAQSVAGQQLNLNNRNMQRSFGAAQNSNAFFTSNRLDRQNRNSASITGPRTTFTHSASPRTLTTITPRTARPLVRSNAQEQGSSVMDKAYTQLQIQHAKKEHRLRIQHMTERHNAEMVLAHLQQELVREQLRELRQPTGAINT